MLAVDTRFYEQNVYILWCFLRFTVSLWCCLFLLWGRGLWLKKKKKTQDKQDSLWLSVFYPWAFRGLKTLKTLLISYYDWSHVSTVSLLVCTPLMVFLKWVGFSNVWIRFWRQLVKITGGFLKSHVIIPHTHKGRYLDLFWTGEH